MSDQFVASTNQPKSSFANLTPAEIKRSREAETQGLHRNVAWQMIFGKNSDAVLASEVRIENPQKYRDLKLQWQLDTKQIKRPTPTPTEESDY